MPKLGCSVAYFLNVFLGFWVPSRLPIKQRSFFCPGLLNSLGKQDHDLQCKSDRCRSHTRVDFDRVPFRTCKFHLDPTGLAFFQCL